MVWSFFIKPIEKSHKRWYNIENGAVDNPKYQSMI